MTPVAKHHAIQLAHLRHHCGLAAAGAAAQRRQQQQPELEQQRLLFAGQKRGRLGCGGGGSGLKWKKTWENWAKFKVS